MSPGNTAVVGESVGYVSFVHYSPPGDPSLINVIDPSLCENPLSLILLARICLTETRLAARLYQHTNDTHYLDTMQLTLNFLTHQLYNGNIIMDGITLATCEVSNQIVTQNSGWAIDGLTTVAAMNSSWEPL